MAALCRTLAVLFVIAGILEANAEQNYDSGVTEAADFAIGYHNRNSHYEYAYKVTAILSNTAQMNPPARVKYTMTVEVGQTTCKNTPDVNLAACNLQDSMDLKTMTCNFVVLTVPHASFPVPSYLFEDQCH